MVKIEVIGLLREYVSIQKVLCETLFDIYPFDDVIGLTELPKTGNLAVSDDFWEFHRHGSGVRFTETSSQVVVDVHAALVHCTSGFDAWRVVSFCESKGISELTYEGRVYDATSEKSLKDLFQRITKDEVLDVYDPAKQIYVLREQRSGRGRDC